jgi:hypothetical protein
MAAPESSIASTAHRPLPPALVLGWVVNLTLAVIAAAVYAGQAIFRWKYPADPFFIPSFGFTDLLRYQRLFQLFHTLQFYPYSNDSIYPITYPAPVAMLYQLYYLAGSHALLAFFVTTGVGLLLLGWLLAREMVRAGMGRGVTIALLLTSAMASYPLWAEYALANLEMCVFLFVAAALLAFLSGRYYLAAFLLGLCGAMKLFPLIYFALFLSRKRYGALVFGLGTAIAFTVFSLWMLTGSVTASYQGVQSGVAYFHTHYMLSFHRIETGFDHSLFGVVKQFTIHLVGGAPMRESWLKAYLVFCAITAVGLYIWKIRSLPLVNQVMCCCILSLLLSTPSHDYTLIHLYFSWGLLILCALRDRSAAWQRYRLPFVLFALLFSFESEIFAFPRNLSGQFKAGVLVALLLVALTRPFRLEVGRDDLPLETATSA